jgi:hypothetical protein
LRSPRSHHDSDKHHQILTLSHETQREICLLPFHDHQEIESWHGIAVISSPLETTPCYQMFDLYPVSARLFCFCFCFPNTKYPHMVLELLVLVVFFFYRNRSLGTKITLEIRGSMDRWIHLINRKIIYTKTLFLHLTFLFIYLFTWRYISLIYLFIFLLGDISKYLSLSF